MLSSTGPIARRTQITHPVSISAGRETAAKIKAAKDRIAEWLKTCQADWDEQTHMTKAEWTATCRRVSTERGKFLLDETSKGYLPELIDKAPRKGTRVY